MNNKNKSMYIFVLAGILFGIASYYTKSHIYYLVLMLIGLMVTQLSIKKLLKVSEKFNWYMSNGGWIYIFVWFIVLTIMINVIK